MKTNKDNNASMKADNTPTIEDEFLDTSSYKGEESTRLNTVNIFGVNPFNRNAKELKDGGFKLPIEKIPDYSKFLNFGSKMTMTPQKGNAYEVLGCTSFEAVLLGATPTYNVVDESIALGEGNGNKVVIPNGDWVTVSGKNATVTAKKLYFVLRNDPGKTIYVLNLNTSGTKYGEALVSSVAEIQDAYRGWKAIAKKLKKDQVDLPGSFIGWFTIGIPETPFVAGKGDKTSDITPPVILWKGARPKTYAEFKQYGVTLEEYNEFAELAKKLDEYLKGENAPNRVGELSEDFLQVAELVQLESGKVVSRNALPAPKRVAQIEGKLETNANDPENAPNLTFAQYIAKNDMASLDKLFSFYNVNKEAFTKAYEISEVTEAPGTIRDTFVVFLAENQ